MALHEKLSALSTILGIGIFSFDLLYWPSLDESDNNRNIVFGHFIIGIMQALLVHKDLRISNRNCFIVRLVLSLNAFMNRILWIVTLIVMFTTVDWSELWLDVFTMCEYRMLAIC